MNILRWIARNNKQIQWLGLGIFILLAIGREMLYRRVDEDIYRLLQFVPVVFLMLWSGMLWTARKKYASGTLPEMNWPTRISGAVAVLIVAVVGFYLINRHFEPQQKFLESMKHRQQAK